MGLINKILGTLPSGIVSELSDDAMTELFRKSYIENPLEKQRQAAIRKRIDLYKDRGAPYFEKLIDQLFDHIKNRDVRKRYIDIAQYQNLTRRITREISAVYSEPAKRTVKGKTMNRNYQDLQMLLRMDRRMRLANQMTNLCNETVIWFDKVLTGTPKIRVVTPDNFWAVHHPNDPTQLACLIFDRAPAHGAAVTALTPRYIVLTPDEHFALNDKGQLISATRALHGLTRMPAILVHRTEPDTALLDSDPGNDITAAHEALALMNIMLLKHQKSGTKQAVASGDLGNMPREQQMDGESMLNAPEGVLLSSLDLGANPDSYITTARSIIKQIAANHGIPESVFDLSYQATSGFEIELKRSSLKEIRQDQILDWRPTENELVAIMVESLAEGHHPLAFNDGGWGVDFGETDTPQEPISRLAYWRELKALGLMNQIDMYVQLNPEATEEEAQEEILGNIETNAVFVELLRSLNMDPNTGMDGSGRDDAGKRPPKDEDSETGATPESVAKEAINGSK